MPRRIFTSCLLQEIRSWLNKPRKKAERTASTDVPSAPPPCSATTLSVGGKRTPSVGRNATSSAWRNMPHISPSATRAAAYLANRAAHCCFFDHMSKCVYTGARVFVEEYQAIGVADIHAMGDDNETIIINFNPRSFTYTGNKGCATHVVEIGRGYWHVDKGILIVPRENLIGELR